MNKIWCCFESVPYHGWGIKAIFFDEGRAKEFLKLQNKRDVDEGYVYIDEVTHDLTEF
jgi:hypothetical protein